MILDMGDRLIDRWASVTHEEGECLTVFWGDEGDSSHHEGFTLTDVRNAIKHAKCGIADVALERTKRLESEGRAARATGGPS